VTNGDFFPGLSNKNIIEHYNFLASDGRTAGWNLDTITIGMLLSMSKMLEQDVISRSNRAAVARKQDTRRQLKLSDFR
jgi:hypothetical protein